MKIKIVKQSGNPVDAKVYEAYKDEFTSRFDEIQIECAVDMQIMHETLEMLDCELAGVYGRVEEIEFPRSARAAKALIDLYGYYMVTTNVDTGELMFVILDEGL